ncbi:hypothetical protein JZ751_008058 [Albula glossodonta]|uniref:Gasdermin pore forming domain-containing protein n=1 Tax=Albula glossodonta TaxID=121402 RepID=A0A8T2NYS5_9TELE|nr:hypothetical protein JZ751_008058 [Albula glossodonta]
MKELDSDGDLHPLSSIIESKLLEVLSVVKIVESRKCWFLKSVRYRPTGVELHELLQCPDTVDCGESQKTDIGTVDIMQDGCGNVGVSFGESMLWNVGAKGEVLHTTSATGIKVECVSVNLTKLDNVLQNSKVNERHFLIQEMRRNSQIRGLGVIYQIVKADNMNLGQKSRGQASVNLSAVDAATLDAGGKVDQEKKLKLGGGCALAFKARPLLIDIGDFKELKKSVTNELQAFMNMDRGTKKSIWDDLSRTTKCPQALYILDCMLEEGHVSADSPSPLDEVPGNLREGIQKLLELVRLYDSDFSGPDSLLSSLGLLVSSAAVLDEEAVNLTINLGGEDRGQVLKLVEAALEKVCGGDFSDPQWSKRFSESIVSVTNQILVLCGLKLGEDMLDPSLGTSGAPDGALLALYILLLGGNMLLES